MRIAATLIGLTAPAFTTLSGARLTPVLATIMALVSAPCFSAAETDGKSWAIGVHFENDLFADTDSQYTNGIKITAVSPDLNSLFKQRDDLPTWLRALLPLEHLPFETHEKVTRTFAFSLGQNMYTPNDTTQRALIANDRPYAGWLYLGATFQTRSEDQQDTFDAQFGVIGPYSFAQESQEQIHRLRGFSVPQGWNNQLRSEPAVVLAYERTWRHRLGGRMRAGPAVDLLTRAGGAIGNVAVYASSAAQVRAGWNLPLDFGYSVIRPGGVSQISTLPQANNRGDTSDQHALLRTPRWSAYAFLGAEGRMIGRDIFLHGNTWRDSHSVDHKPFVADLMAGVTMSLVGLKISLARVLRTREFRGQSVNHRFGSITVSYAF
ncbi:MAG: lipid A 3-O-deacylase [Gammaproteobacteria bacterium]|jgi:lipid A 3-O-deacylase